MIFLSELQCALLEDTVQSEKEYHIRRVERVPIFHALNYVTTTLKISSQRASRHLKLALGGEPRTAQSILLVTSMGNIEKCVVQKSRATQHERLTARKAICKSRQVPCTQAILYVQRALTGKEGLESSL